MVTPIEPAADKSRIVAFDGLRGIAAFVVIVSHFLLAFTPVWFTGSGTLDWTAPDIAAKTPLFLIQSGTFAVFVFFALSGFVMAQSASHSRAPLLALAGTRLLRLNIPVAASVLLAYVLIHIFPAAVHEVADRVRHWWIEAWYPPGGPSVGAAMLGLARGSYKASLYFNPVAWTMRVELIGSLIIYAIYKAVPARWIVHALVAGLLVTFFLKDTEGYLFGFFAGALLHEHWSRGLTFPTPALWAALIGGLFLGSFPFMAPRGPLYAWLDAGLAPVTYPDLAVRNIGAILLLAAILYLPGPRAVLSTMIPRFLGRISFALYLVHFPIVCTIAAAAWLAVGPDHQILLFLFYAAITVLAAYLMTIAVDEPTIRALARIRKWSQGWSGPLAFGAGTLRQRQAEAASTYPSKSG